MKKLSCVLLLAGLAGVTGGCNKTASTEPQTTRTSAVERVKRDARSVERKKPGRPKARKRFQFSKR